MPLVALDPPPPVLPSTVSTGSHTQDQCAHRQRSHALQSRKLVSVVPGAERGKNGGREGGTETHLLSLNRRSLRMELVWDGLTSAEDEEASPLPFCCGSVCGDWPRPMSVGLLGELAESMAGRHGPERRS